MVTTFADALGRGDISESADVVVVGTGAGGGAMAAELAEAGLSVILVEEGGYYTSKDFGLDAPRMIKKLYRNAGSAFIQGKPNIIFSEGRCVGGSTVINGGLSWRTPDEVLHRWVKEDGLTELSPEKLAPVFEKVEERVHVSYQDPESLGEDSHLFRAGAEKMGWSYEPVKRNQKHCAGSDNCVFGCPTDAKQSTLVSYIPRALARGARLYAGCRVEKVLTSAHRASGIEARFYDPETGQRGPMLRVDARAVVLSCGAIQTPVLLLKNRMANSSDQVGRNFLCHPNAKLVAMYDHDIFAWKGVLQGYQIHHFRDEGLMFATSMVPPGLLALSLPQFGADSLRLMRDYNKMLTCGILVEDSTTGRVSVDMFGEAKMRYDLTDHDFAQTIRGVGLLGEMMFASGAKKLLMPFEAVPEVSSMDELRRLPKMGLKKEQMECLTVHAMGTCKMGLDKQSSVVDIHGETHDVPGLYIADASVFPGAVGVNPQITVMMFATRTAARIAERLTKS